MSEKFVLVTVGSAERPGYSPSRESWRNADGLTEEQAEYLWDLYHACERGRANDNEADGLQMAFPATFPQDMLSPGVERWDWTGLFKFPTNGDCFIAMPSGMPVKCTPRTEIDTSINGGKRWVLRKVTDGK